MKRSTLFPIFLYPMLLYPVLVALVLCSAPLLVSATKVGAAAPDFTGMASTGKTFRLSDYRGKYVVLEWHNNGCPYVRKQYNSGNMQQLQKQWTSQGVVWFTILSSAPGKQGYATAQEENDYLAKMQAAPTAALLDPAGQIGHLYDAKTSPQMVVINPQGVVIYDGAIDDKPTTDLNDVPGATNYVSLALQQAMAGKQVETSGNASLRLFGEVCGCDTLSESLARVTSESIRTDSSSVLLARFQRPIPPSAGSSAKGSDETIGVHYRGPGYRPGPHGLNYGG